MEPVECRLTRMGMEYAGLKNVDADGRKCQRWLSQTPHKHSMLLHLLEFPDSGLDSHHNYCRNPDERDMSGPWCYPEGSNEKNAKGEEYVGTMRKTETGKECHWWDSKPYGKTDDFDPSRSYEDHFPDNHDKTTTAAENFCRNPTSKERPWCFVADADKKWEYCNISICPDYPNRPEYPECLKTEKGKEYMGIKNKTKTGKDCLRWDSKPYGKPDDFESMMFYGEHFLNEDPGSHENYCRNPALRERPWCFVLDLDIQWEYCDIPMCDDRGKVRMTLLAYRIASP
ncbi:unnamed protein product [Darwinula stevensoni]|uniref:Kringle domain-containing protein n=1 Tax=Darwinula stevensoni TaxID=69355 RepID=A0A7R8X863_9CRUS|nr:unnamed protein product [Darwinula stevensoni]CAG0883081.1 unnamed protein product [Darwinula stevensoni]